MRNFFSKYLSLLLGLILLNCSVDAPDACMRWTPENLNYNEQESIIELLLEKALGFENAIPEYDDTDAFGETSVKKSFCIDYFILPSAEDPKAPIPRVESRVAVCTQQEPVNLFPSVFSPPPEI